MARDTKEPDFADPTCRSFRFTEERVRRACLMAADGAVPVDASGRAQWRDADTPGLFLRVTHNGTGTFTLFYKRDGKPIRKALGPAGEVSVAEAREAVNGLRYDRTLAAQVKPRERHDRNAVTVGEAFEAYIGAAESGLFKMGRRREPITDRTAQNYRDTYKATLVAHADEPLGWLAENVVKLHRTIGTPSGSGKTKKPARPYQANRMLQLVRNIFAHAATAGTWDRPNPCVDPSTGKSIDKFPEHSRDRILSDEEEDRLGKALMKEPALWRDLFAMSLLTGRRMSAICKMRWADVDLSRNVWTVPRSNMKGRKAAHGLMLDPDAVRLLQRRRGETGSTPRRGETLVVDHCDPLPKKKHVGGEWVFPAIRSPGPVATWKTAWGRIRGNAGLAHKDRARAVRPHDLRRSWGSRLVEAGVPTVTVNAALGNSPNSVSMTAKVYMHVPDHVQAEAIDAAYQRRKARKVKGKRAAKRSEATGS